MKKRIACTLIMIFILAACMPVQEAEAITTTVRVGFCSQMPPFQYVDDAGNPRGFHVDILKYIAREENLQLEYQPFTTTFGAMDALEDGEVDMVLGAVGGRYSRYHIYYSDPVSTSNLCLVADKNLASKFRNNRRVYALLACEGFLCDYTYLSSLTSKGMLTKPNQSTAIEELVYGQAEMLVAVKDCLLWYLQEHDIEDNYIIVNNYLASADFTIAVREGDRLLLEGINSNLVTLRTSGGYEDLYDSWIVKGKSADYQRLLKIVLYIACAAGVFLAAYLTVSYRSKRKLTQLVDIRTAELHETNQKLEQRTAQVEAENRLRYSIIEASPAGMILVDENLNLEYMNERAMQIAGIPDFRPGDSICKLRILREIMRDVGNRIFDADWDYKSGTRQFYKDKARNLWEKYRYSIHKITLYGGRKGALITLENVTAEEKEREAAFEKDKNETLNTLIAGIAHEIKNPLTAISASADMMKVKGDNEKFREAYSAYIPQEIDRITRLINSLIDYARPGSSKIEVLSLGEILPPVVELARVTAKNTDFHVEIKKDEVLQFAGDRDKIKQSLLNLIINSIEATRQKKDLNGGRHKIEVEAYRQENHIIIKVTDDGIGMSEEELSRCMNPFYTTKKAGTGIGLSLTRQYVEEVGGTIYITSEKDIFTSVEIRFPVSDEKEDIE